MNSTVRTWIKKMIYSNVSDIFLFFQIVLFFGAIVYERCEFESGRGRTKSLSDEKSNSNTIDLFGRHYQFVYTVKPASTVISIKQSPALKSHHFIVLS
jgi:hypothetical protein